MDSNKISFSQAILATASLNIDELHGYQAKTLRKDNQARINYLALFPTIFSNRTEELLLANVPVKHLPVHEITRRQEAAYTTAALMMIKDYDYLGGFGLFPEDTEELATRLNIGKSIITFNADRLRGICSYLLLLHEKFRKNYLRYEDVALPEPTLNSKQMAIALEFFLQIDVDVFFMKTCSFRDAVPWPKSEGLFCNTDEPQARYSLMACRNLFCRCCHPFNHYKRNQTWPVVDFIYSSKHQFINGYTTYLNCPATCTTSNVIYALTCPCGQYDYIDSTAQTLVDALTIHREDVNQVISEKLTGMPRIRGSIFDPKELRKSIANKMRLYEHSARCPVALRAFLDCNPAYWCFIPLSWNEALEENATFLRENSSEDSILAPLVTPISTNEERRIDNYMKRVPVPPTSYVFSYRQTQEQREFFHRVISAPINLLQYIESDLYTMSLIAVLPDDYSVILRYIIETLFIIHAETKLNMICPIGGDAENLYGSVFDFVWCANLKRQLPMPNMEPWSE